MSKDDGITTTGFQQYTKDVWSEPWYRKVAWGLLVVAIGVLAIIGSGVWAAIEVWQRAHDGIY